MKTKLCHRTSCNLNNYTLFLFTNYKYNIIKRFNISFSFFLSSFLVAESAAISRGFCIFVQKNIAFYTIR